MFFKTSAICCRIVDVVFLLQYILAGTTHVIFSLTSSNICPRTTILLARNARHCSFVLYWYCIAFQPTRKRVETEKRQNYLFKYQRYFYRSCCLWRRTGGLLDKSCPGQKSSSTCQNVLSLGFIDHNLCHVSIVPPTWECTLLRQISILTFHDTWIDMGNPKHFNLVSV